MALKVGDEAPDFELPEPQRRHGQALGLPRQEERRRGISSAGVHAGVRDADGQLPGGAAGFDAADTAVLGISVDAQPAKSGVGPSARRDRLRSAQRLPSARRGGPKLRRSSRGRGISGARRFPGRQGRADCLGEDLRDSGAAADRGTDVGRRRHQVGVTRTTSMSASRWSGRSVSRRLAIEPPTSDERWPRATAPGTADDEPAVWLTRRESAGRQPVRFTSTIARVLCDSSGMQLGDFLRLATPPSPIRLAICTRCHYAEQPRVPTGGAGALPAYALSKHLAALRVID